MAQTNEAGAIMLMSSQVLPRPLLPRNEAAGVVAPRPRSFRPPLPVRALIVDADPVDANGIACMLEGVCAETANVGSGFDALRCLQCATNHRHPFDLVILAWSLPGMNGLQTAQRIRGNPLLHRQPSILMLTAHSRAQSAFETAMRGELWTGAAESSPGPSLGASPGPLPGYCPMSGPGQSPATPPNAPRAHFLHKPVDAELLRDVVHLLLQNSQQTHQDPHCGTREHPPPRCPT